MHTLIVSGTSWCDIPTFQQLLEDAGMAPVKPATSGSVTNLGTWHDRLFSGQPSPSSAMHVGKSWELAASEIFLANWDQPIWGWGDARNIWLLDFWRNFDASTFFVLIHTPATTVLARALKDVTTASFNPAAILDEWCTGQAEMLRFFNRNHDRCILVHSDQLLSATSDVLQNLNARLGIELSMSQPAPPSPPSVGALDLWLIAQAFSEHPKAQALQQELLSSLTISYDGDDGKSLEPTFPTISGALSQLRSVYVAHEQLTQALAGEQQRNAILQTEALKHHEALSEQRHEKEILLMQLHETQEDMENSIASYQLLQQQGITQAQEQQSQLRLQAANEVLATQLHNTQQELERCAIDLVQSRRQQQAGASHWERLSQRYPDYYEWDSIKPVKSAKDMHWHIRGLAVSEHPLPLIDVCFAHERDHWTLILNPPDDMANSPLLRWPRVGAATLDAAPSPLRLESTLSNSDENRALLRQLAPTDIRVIRAICCALIEDLPNDHSNRENIISHLKRLSENLQRLPNTLRFDKVQIKQERILPGYEHLWLSLKNVNFGDRSWANFEFRLGAAMIQSDAFSTLPRLEFPLIAGQNKQFSQWFEESTDEYGPKFELRYDTANNSTDITTWKALDSVDQIQALSLIAHLPAILKALQHEGVIISRPWDDWIKLTLAIQATMSMLGLPANTFELV